MKHTYNITGMTCNGCRTDVENRLNAVDGVDEAVVTLENEKAVITMNSHISLETFQKALPEKYTITVQQERNVFESTSIPTGRQAFAEAEPTRSKLEQLKPLFLILGYISIATILLNYQRENWDGAMLDFMGMFYIVFSFFKMLDLKGFPESFRMYDPLAKVLPVYGWIYPFIETALGLMFLMRFQVDMALIFTLVVLGITTIGVTRTLLDKKAIQCACLGTALKLPMTEATFIENVIMIIMAVFMLCYN
ncbi:MAG: heavy-metal-associated domain-containing protein [Nonlabens sp.]|uniref:heavy-metal-associated domain-containing protein n=1 Tax=Nonlabens sp. TaxID=1888209 RepID=UPI003EFB21DF